MSAKISKDRIELFDRLNVPKDCRIKLSTDVDKYDRCQLIRLWPDIPGHKDMSLAALRVKVLELAILSNRNHQERMKVNIRKREQYAAEFQKLFGYPIRRFFSNPFFGFDVTSFDAVVVKSGDRSMFQVLEEKFGAEAAKMIDDLLTVQDPT